MPKLGPYSRTAILSKLDGRTREARLMRDGSLRRLGLEYLDLFMLHWPVPSNFDATVEAWKAAEKLLVEGRTSRHRSG